MRVIVEYAEEVATPFGREFFQEIAERTLAERCFSFLQGKKISLNVIAISENKIKKLNKTYRGKDAVTDILSFGEYAARLALKQETSEAIFLGEIFFCPAFIAKRAKADLSREAMKAMIKVDKKRDDGRALKCEMVYIFSHGVLHLVGFDHEEEMFVIQEKVADLFMKHKNKLYATID